MIAGNLVKDPRLNHTMNGTPVSNFTIASNRRFGNGFGKIKEDVCFLSVVAWYNLGEVCAENLHQGRAVLVTGELQSRQKRTVEGYSRNMVEIKARRVQFLDKQNVQLQRLEPINGNANTSHSSVPSERDEENTDGREEKSAEISTYDFRFRELKL